MFVQRFLIKEAKSKSDRGIIYVESIAYNQNDLDVLSFKRKVLVKRKSHEKIVFDA